MAPNSKTRVNHMLITFFSIVAAVAHDQKRKFWNDDMIHDLRIFGPDHNSQGLRIKSITGTEIL